MTTTPPWGAAPPLRLATRGSPLARWQAERVATLLGALRGAPPCETVIVHTTGDARLDVPLHQLGGQGVFVKEVQAALLDGRADIAVHSAKDLPAQTPPGLCLACVPEREDPRDGLLGASLEDLPVGAAVATGSVRRRAQLAWLRPDLTFVELRGNMAARVAHAEAVGAGIVAVAGLQRLGLGHRITQILEPSTMLPQVAQGALALECREDDDATRVWLAAIDNPGIHRAVRAERAFLDALGGGCTLPVGALATALSPDSSGPELVLEGLLATRDGHVVLRRRRQGSDPEALGRNVAGELLDDCGGRFLGDWSGGAG